MRTIEEISALYNAYMDRAEALRYAKVERMRKLAKLAHIDSGSNMFMHLHNCSFGKKWIGVDYHYIHQMKLIEQDIFKAHGLVRAWENRQYNEMYKYY